MICYPAVIEYDRAEHAYNVSFPDLPGCLTFGDTLEEAKDNAREALSAYLESIGQPQAQGAGKLRTRRR